MARESRMDNHNDNDSDDDSNDEEKKAKKQRKRAEKEMKKHKEFFKKHGIFALIYTDSDLKDTKTIFDDMVNYLEPRTAGRQLQFHIIEDFFNQE